MEITRRAFLWTKVLDSPFWAIFNMLPFILYKDLHATPLQLAVMIALKSLSSIFSIYWSDLIRHRRDRLVSNVVWGGILRHAPFFFFPWVENIWFFIFAFGFHMMLSRGAQPAWMEILKLNIQGEAREKVFAWGSVMGYVADALLPFMLGWILDGYFQSWRVLFPAAAALSLLPALIQMRIPIVLKEKMKREKASFKEALVGPWKGALTLMKSRPDFLRFQVGFMLGGTGLMVMQPALPVFFVDVLNLSFTEFAIALTTCKGVGYALTSPGWAKLLRRSNLFRFTAAVTALGALFPLCLMAAPSGLLWLYAGYVIYGVMQAGSSLSWNMSGPIFANEEDSSVYTSLNVAMVGFRGCFAPAMGSAMMALWGSGSVMIAGAVLFLIATQRLISYSFREDPTGSLGNDLAVPLVREL